MQIHSLGVVNGPPKAHYRLLLHRMHSELFEFLQCYRCCVLAVCQASGGLLQAFLGFESLAQDNSFIYSAKISAQ